VTGSLEDASTKFGGGDDTAGFFLSIGENSAECVFEDFRINSGPNNATSGSACILASGRRNAVRNSTLVFPAHTGDGLAIRSNATDGNPSVDCGYDNVEVQLPVGRRFFTAADSGAGVTRAYFRNLRCFGAVTSRAGDVQGDQGVVENVWCESGGFRLFDPCTNWRIENNYFPDGFESLSRAALNANIIRNNESDASRRIAAAAIVNTAQNTVTTTTANAVEYSMAIAPGDLASLDEVHVRLAGTAGGGGANVRHVRVTCSIDGTTEVEVAHLTTTLNGDSWAVEGTMEVQSNSVIHASFRQHTEGGGATLDSRLTKGDLAGEGLTLTVQIWTENSGSILVQLVKIAGQKAGMHNVPVFH
jgi:hypothetical protein